MNVYKLKYCGKRIKSVMANVSVAAICTIFVAGCVPGPSNDRFPNLKADLATLSTVDVVLDVTVLADIKGDAIGIDRENHLTTISEWKAAIQKKFNEIGAGVNFIHAGSGVFHSNDPDTQYFYSENYKSTGEVFRGYELPMPIGEPDNVAFLRKVLQEAEEYNKKKISGDETLAPVVFAGIPPFFVESGAERLVVVKIFRNNVSFGKRLGMNVLAEAMMMPVGGGESVGVSPSDGIGTAISMAIVDTSTGRLIWQTRATDSKTTVNAVLAAVLKRLDL